MACSTCGHTMQMVAHEVGKVIHWCPRCGTLQTMLVNHTSAEPPRLVERCRGFEKEIHEFHDLDGHTRYEITKNEWRTFGIAESINLPENRPQ